jgi:ABC-type transporter Mla subunit MlaD
MRRAIISGFVVLAAVGFVVVATGAKKQSAAGTYKIELDNAFGLVKGADFKVAGVPAGTIKEIGLDQKTLRAVVTIEVKAAGFGRFHTDATCDSRPESLIGEYFIDCNPGSSGPVLKSGGTIPGSHTQSTIPADLVQNVMRMPYRQRFTLIVNELGAAVAARSGDLQSALRRAVPALTETDNLLALLGNDSTTIQNLTRDSNSVITALANNSANVNRFIVEAGRTSTATATQQPARPAIKSLGQAAVTGKAAVTAATPTIKDLNAFAKPTPELAGNLAIVLHDLDDPSRAVERDSRSPGGNGFTGLQALLGYGSTRRWRSTPSDPRATSWPSTRSSARCAPTTARRRRSRWRSSSTARSTASATRGWAPTSPESTRPTRRTRPPRCQIRAARLPARAGP